MSQTATPDVIEDIDLDSLIGRAHAHLICCRADPEEPSPTMCGAPHHPEAVTIDTEQSDCGACAKVLDFMRCTKGHNHCPFTPRWAPPPVCPPRSTGH